LKFGRQSVAITVSVGLHALVLAVVGRLDAPATLEVRPPAPTVVWLGDFPRPRPAEPPPEAPVEDTPERASAESAPEVEVITEPPPEPAPPEETPSPPAQAQVADTEPKQTVDEDAASAETPMAPLVADLDLESLTELTVAAVRGELERESGRITFSTGDGDGDADSARPEPGAIFDAPRSPRVNAMSPGQARTRVGRFAAELCNALTGGFSLGGLLGPLGVTMCSDESVYGTYFAHLKPDYMLKRPVCEEPESLDPLMAEISRRNGIPTTKCRLVYLDELDDGLPVVTSSAQARQ
jgi:hypothetical protein